MTETQLLCWRIGQQYFGIPLSDCKEVREHARVYDIPESRSYVLGVANLRGEVVTVIDLKKVAGMQDSQSARPELSSCTLVRIKDNEQELAIMVDSLADIMTVEEKQMEEPPANFNERQLATSRAVVQTEKGMLIVLAVSEIKKVAD